MSVDQSQVAVRASATAALRTGSMPTAPHVSGTPEPLSESPRAFDMALMLASQCQVLASLHATAAHDFRNSLNAMALSVELLGRTVEADVHDEQAKAVQRRSVESLRQELGVMTPSVADVLEQSRLDQVAVPCRLGGLLESVVSLLRAKAQRQRVTIDTEVADTTIDVFGRPGEIRLALLNLAANALEAMPRGGRLTFGLSSDGTVAALAVSDTGPGVPDDARPRIWDLFFSTKRDGLGLGLHVVRSIAETHGGTAALESAAAGARFVVQLPLRS